MTIEPFAWTLSSMAGGMLGTIFYGGLWWTVKKGASSERSALWFFGSLQLRMAIALVGFYFVSSGHWDRMVACLAGFFLARILVTQFTIRLERLPDRGLP